MPTQVDALRLRLEEKETMLNKKTKQIQEIAEEKGTQAGEIHDLKDMLDVKERKVNVLQKKVSLCSYKILFSFLTHPYSCFIISQSLPNIFAWNDIFEVSGWI